MAIDLREREYRACLSIHSNCVDTVPFHSFECSNSVPISTEIVRLTTRSSPHCQCTVVEVDKQVQFQSEHIDHEDAVEDEDYSTHHRTTPRTEASDLQLESARAQIRSTYECSFPQWLFHSVTEKNGSMHSCFNVSNNTGLNTSSEIFQSLFIDCGRIYRMKAQLFVSPSKEQ